MTTQINFKTFLWLILSFVGFFLLFNLGNYLLVNWDEAMYGEVARQMYLSGDFLQLRLNDQNYAEKPVLLFIFIQFFYEVFGVSEFSARFTTSLFAFFTFTALYIIGKQLRSREFGLIWACAYLFCLTNTIIAHSLIHDTTFNFFILMGVYSLYRFNGELLTDDIKAQWKWLTIASISMGVGVLVKGPLAGFLPIFSYGVFLLIQRKPLFSLKQFVFCGALSLSIALSWYGLNLYLKGGHFLERFVEFQGDLFSKSLQGHTGPFYYHVVAIFIGFMPWTVFLFTKDFKEVFRKSHPQFPLSVMVITWAVVIVTVMSMVKTKLPHYTSSTYIALGFFAALFAEKHFSAIVNLSKLKSFLIWLGFNLTGILLIITGFALGFLIDELNISVEGFHQAQYIITGVAYMMIMSLTYVFLRKRQFRRFILGVGLAALTTWFALSQYLFPTVLNTVQKPLYDDVVELQGEDTVFVFYRTIHFGPFFYNHQKFHMFEHHFLSDGVDEKFLRENHCKKVVLVTNNLQSTADEIRLNFPAYEQTVNELDYQIFIKQKNPDQCQP